jgi:hypothetical protein
MSGLQERLDRIKEGFVKQVPQEVLQVMAGAEEELRSSGIIERIPAPGSPLPGFELADTDGSVVSSTDLLARGPLVLTVYRGAW